MVFCSCFRAPEEYYDPDEVIPKLWQRNSAHFFGQFSSGVLRGNTVIEDYSQVEVDDGVVFCGVYHGHGGGTRASRFIAENLYDNFRRIVQESENISEDMLLNAFAQTENEFLDIVESEFTDENQEIASHGSSCLVGVLTGGILHYANLGDSRAVLGYLDIFGKIRATQLTQDHNLNDDTVRQEYQTLHSGNDGLLVEEAEIWRIKGILKVTRCIGDGNFKRDNLAIQDGDFHIPGRTQRPLVSAIPSVQSRRLHRDDGFVIFATNALWELLANREAAQLVHKGPREGAAKRLIQEALRRRAENASVRYDILVRAPPKRRDFDDISVIVLFVDHDLLENMRDMPSHSVRSFDDEDSPSDILEEIRSFGNEDNPSYIQEEIRSFDGEDSPSDLDIQEGD